jgi:hypothetical protein
VSVQTLSSLSDTQKLLVPSSSILVSLAEPLRTYCIFLSQVFYFISPSFSDRSYFLCSFYSLCVSFFFKSCFHSDFSLGLSYLPYLCVRQTVFHQPCLVPSNTSLTAKLDSVRLGVCFSRELLAT